jgi:hypothetical protein
VAQSGTFLHLTEEKGKLPGTFLAGGPPSFRLHGPTFVGVGEPATFTVSDAFVPGGGGVNPWRFFLELDGTSKNTTASDAVTHRFARPGQYFVTVRMTDAVNEVARKQLAVFVGMKPAKDVVCRLLMKGALRDGFNSWIWQGGWDKVDYTLIPDASGANNLGFLAGGTWVKDAERGLVLELDGRRDRVEISNSADINAGASYPKRTVAFRFRANGHVDAKGQPLRQVLYEEGGGGAGLNCYLDGPVLRAGLWVQGKGTWLQSKEVSVGAWHHVALVVRAAGRDAKEAAVELYLDGDRIAAGTAPPLGVHTGDINLGRSGSTRYHDRAADQPGAYFAGRLDDFRILNQSLTADEVRALAKE